MCRHKLILILRAATERICALEIFPYYVNIRRVQAVTDFDVRKIIIQAIRGGSIIVEVTRQ